MPQLETLKKQAKQLVRWHRERNYSVGERLRSALPRYRDLTDIQILALKFPLAEAQEVIALEAGYPSWADLKLGEGPAEPSSVPARSSPTLHTGSPCLFVSNATRSAEWFRDVLGFGIDMLHGHPPFFAQVSRGGAKLSLRYVRGPVFVGDIREREQLVAAMVHISGVNALYLEFRSAGADFFQPLKRQPWGAKDFTVRDPDGNLICFGAAVGED